MQPGFFRGLVRGFIITAAMLAVMRLLAACGAPDHTGVWTYSGQNCGGEPTLVPGFSARLDMTGEQASLTTTTAECSVLQSGIPVTTSNGPVRIHEGAASQVACQPTGCNIHLRGEPQTCPQDFPVPGVIYEVVSVTEEEMVTRLGSCEQTWLRDE